MQNSIKRSVICGCLTLLCSLATLSAATAPLSENFDDGVANNFVLSSTVSGFSVVPLVPSGQAYQSEFNLAASAGRNSSAGLQVTNVSSPGASLTLSTKVVFLATPSTGSGFAQVGVGLHGQSANFSSGSQYRVVYSSLGFGNKLQIVRNNVTVASSELGFKPKINVPYTLTVTSERVSGSLKLRAILEEPDVRITVSYTDSAPLSGEYFGYRTAAQAPSTAGFLFRVRYDDFSLAVGLPPPEPAATASVAGSLDVGGALDVAGSDFTLGSSGQSYGAGFFYDNGSSPGLTFDLANSAAGWSWRHGATTKMVLNAQGYLGLGKAAPAERLDIAGNAQISGRLGIMVGAPQHSYLQVGANGGSSLGRDTYPIMGIDTRPQNSGNGGVIGVYSWPIQGKLPVGPAGDVTAFIGKVRTAGGNVINGKVLEAQSPDISNNGSSFSNVYGVFIHQQKMLGVTSGYGVFQAGSADTNHFAGNVGIGTATPSEKLEVSGKIKATEVTAQKIRVPQSGDIGMGAFTAGQAPTP